MDYDGSIISSILPPIPVKADVRIAQIKTASDQKKTLTIAKALFQAKITRSLQLLDWLALAYDIEAEMRATKREAMRVSEVSTVPQLRTAEGRVALYYWQAFRQCLPKELGFQGRGSDGRNRNASDAANAVLNYGYGFLQCECRKAVNSVGLEAGIGYSHTTTEWQTKESLVLDLMEPYRWLVDLTVFQLFESGVLNSDSCFFQESDYRYRIFTDSKGKLLDALREKFNSGVKYKGLTLKWDTLIAEKTNELARFLTGKSSSIDFSEPAPALERTDNREIRERILSLTQSEAEKLGIGKSELHYLRRKAGRPESFRLYGKVREKIAEG
jgi:CRISPR-associated protein Cas1